MSSDWAFAGPHLTQYVERVASLSEKQQLGLVLRELLLVHRRCGLPYVAAIPRASFVMRDLLRAVAYMHNSQVRFAVLALLVVASLCCCCAVLSLLGLSPRLGRTA